MSGTLDQFLRDKKEKIEEESPPVDWDARRIQWLDSLNHLYGVIDDWLSELKEDGTVTVSTEPKTLEEEDLGCYEANSLVIKVGPAKVTLEPLGTVILGAYGRIDIKGSKGSVMLVEPEWNDWQIAIRTPRLKTVPLTEDSFTDVLKEIMGE